MKISFMTISIIFMLILVSTISVNAEDATGWSGPSVGIYQQENGSLLFRFYNPNDGVAMVAKGEIEITGNEGFESIPLNFTVSPRGEFKEERKLPDWATRARVVVDYTVNNKTYPVQLSRPLTPIPSTSSKATPAASGFQVIGGLITLILVLKVKGKI